LYNTNISHTLLMFIFRLYYPLPINFNILKQHLKKLVSI
jgi:hypothetical protein